MPEGDIVFWTAQRLREALAGRELTAGEIRHPRWSTAELAGDKVAAVSSVGKHLFVRFATGRSLHSHLRMDGAWQVYPCGARWRGPAHQVRAVLATGERDAVGFRLHDLALLPTAQESRLVGHLGPDLLDPAWSHRHRAEATSRLTTDPDRPLGLALVDQSVMAGVGNLYRAETCFLLGVAPWVPVREVDAERAVTLCRSLLWRNRLRPEQNTTGIPARRAQQWVYRRAGLPCRRCGDRIVSAPIGDGTHRRTVWYCPTCQRTG